MRAVDRYVEAEAQIECAAIARADGEDDAVSYHLRLAQANATLALAGATALQSYARVGDDDSELDDWKAAAGGES
ncbi:hypothetical protein [Pseudonocardia sp. 73-21]|uniref:hypothetical protein n=1 Tax=Pseudonocardia sp. 73-21 TaxID=1895809 RepID=UPI0009612DC2|nr:hypothetical protein [Pseudonocardia sp. 73-21]OJY47629.1 MAG: hypothetical protein BGP03_33390 [Pseudonocardia sp. 73-21]